MRHKVIVAVLLSTAGLTSAPVQTLAQTAVPQTATAADNTGEITVTARRRDETLIAVPVVITALNQKALVNRGIVNLDGLARVVPQLLIGPQGSSIQGGNISIRGIAGPDSNPFGDQAVSFDIDGIQIAKANVRRTTDFDVQQIEVLKGPQALYFGKNSMAGIVNIQTVDPTKSLEVGGKIGYEFDAREIRAEGYVSGPIGDNLGVRLAGQYSHMQGYLIDQTPTSSTYYDTARAPRSTSYGLRGTLKYNGPANFDAKLKVNYGKVTGNGPAATTEFVSCPFGARQFSFLPAGADNSQCTPGDHTVNAGYGPVVSTLGGTLDLFRANGRNFTNQEQVLAGFVMHYRPSDEIELTSATGLYYINLNQAQNYENSFAVLLPSVNILKNREFSQEFNVTSKFSGPLNFTGGLYFSDTWAKTGSLTYLFAAGFPLLGAVAPGLGAPDTPAQVNNYLFTQKGNAYSAFLQTSYKPVSQLEISVGGRYTHESKRLTDVRDGGGISDTRPGPFTTVLDASTIVSVANGGLALDHASWDDFSPEATINYRPDRDLTLFASYKHGFLSGGFNSSSVNLGTGNLDLSYKPQTIKGFEGGVKTRLLDGKLLLNAAVYHYLVSDLQVVNFTNASSTIRNAAASKIDGAEFDVSYRTPLDGLTLNGAAAYNRAKYTSFPGAACYNGEAPAQGCTIISGNPEQNLAGQPVARSPKWNASVGLSYETRVGDNLNFGLNAGLNYSGSFYTDATDAPNGIQRAYTLVDASTRIGAANDTWQLSLIGRNLTNKFYFVSSTDVPFTGSGSGTAGGVLGDRFASVSRGREILVQASFKFGR